MDISEELHAVGEALSAAEVELTVATAKVVGLRAQRASLERALRNSVQTEQNMNTLGGLDLSYVRTRTTAIEMVLEHASGAMGPSEILAAMAGAGRNAAAHNDNEYVVVATLAQMVKANRIVKIGRGKYKALSNDTSAENAK